VLVFETAASTFDKGIVVESNTGVFLSQSMSTTTSKTLLDLGPGTLTILSTMTLSTTNQLLTVTADDVTLSGQVSTGSSAVIFECDTDGRTVGLGDTGSQFVIEDAELGNIRCSGMTIGGAKCATQTLEGITNANSVAVAGILTLWHLDTARIQKWRTDHHPNCCFGVQHSECASR